VYRVHNRSNAEIFSNLELSSLESDVTFFGNFLQKGAAEDTLDWLRNLRHFSISDDIFLQQILEPVREIARYRIRVGKLGTTRLHGWIFAKSKPFVPYTSSHTEEKNVRVVLSVLFPLLQTIMSIRVSETLANTLGYKMHDFESIMPVPHVNRMRQSKKAAQHISYPPDFSAYHYLSASLVDIEKFACSLEMRHYCEISTEQSDKSGAFLGALLIIPGRINYVDGDLIQVQSILKQQDCVRQFWISTTNKKMLPKKIGDYVGKLVTIAAVKWYSSDFKEPDTNPEFDEMISMQEKSDESVLAKNELLGYLRIRGTATVGEIMDEFGEDQCNKLLGKWVSGKSRTEKLRYPQLTTATDTIVTEFLASTDRIRRLRFGANHQHGLFLMPEDVLDKKKIDAGGISLWLIKIGDMSSLLQLLNNFDNSERSTFKSREIPVDKNARGSVIRRWKGFGIAVGDNRMGYKITNRGKDIAYAAARDMIARNVNTSGPVIALPELENKNHLIPPSLTLKYLKEQEVAGAVKKSHSELFWFGPATAATEQKNQQQVTDNLEDYANFVKEKMYETPNDRTRKSIHDLTIQKFQCSHFIGKIICNIAEKNCIEVVDNPVEKSWRLPLDERILHSFRKNPAAVTVEELQANPNIMPSTGHGLIIGKIEETRVIREELESLHQKNLVKESEGRWKLANT